MNFKDIKAISRANYKINLPWKHLNNAIEDWSNDYGFSDSPEFQRDHVWTKDQQSKYIEYVLKGGMSGKELYFNCATWDETFDVAESSIVVVDGKQRLKAVRDFLRGEVKAFNHFLHEFKGKLPHKAEFIISINGLKTDREVYQWYLDLNDGGNVHTEEELNKVRRLLNK